MPYRKYREAKQWGKWNTRIFKTVYKNQLGYRMPKFEVPEALQQMGVEINDPNVPGFFNKFAKNVPSLNHPMFKPPTLKDHPLYKDQKAHLFEGNRSFADGIDQACALTKSLKANSIPSEIIDANKLEWSSNLEDLVCDSILAGERYDPSLDLLDKRHDPILFWTIQHARHGIPKPKKNNIILENFYRRVCLHAMNTKGLMMENRYDYDAPISACLSTGLFGSTAPFVIRHQPHLTVQTPGPARRIASRAEVEATISEKVPNIYPLSPLVDLQWTNIYNNEALIPRSQQHIQKLHLNTLLFTKKQNQKYPFTTEELAANAIVFCFGAALAQAQRLNNKIDLIEQPILTKVVQLVDGCMDFVVFQLNTLDLNNTDGVKNLVWVNKSEPLYLAKSEYENFEKVEELNVETFKKFANLLLH